MELYVLYGWWGTQFFILCVFVTQLPQHLWTVDVFGKKGVLYWYCLNLKTNIINIIYIYIYKIYLRVNFSFILVKSFTRRLNFLNKISIISEPVEPCVVIVVTLSFVSLYTANKRFAITVSTYFQMFFLTAPQSVLY